MASARPKLQSSRSLPITPEHRVLIVSTIVDLATDSVVRALEELGTAVVRINTEDLPFSGEIDYSIGIAQPKPIFSTATETEGWYDAVWYRRLRVPTIPSGMDPGIYDFCVRENRNALIGGLIGNQTRWMSHPDAIWKAEFKPYQLRVATNVGLEIPRTLISNRPESIRSFYQSCTRTVAKPVRSGHIVKNGVDCAVFTTKLDDEAMEFLPDAALCPTIYQELIPEACDIRVTIVGQKSSPWRSTLNRTPMRRLIGARRKILIFPTLGLSFQSGWSDCY